METSERNTTPYPNIPPILESDDREFRDTGIVSSVAIAGHPLHPAIVLFPIGFLVAVAGSDLGYWLTRDPFWARASIWLLGAGFISGIVAGITGFLDFFKIKRVRDRSAGWLHMVGNVLALLLSLGNWVMRLGDPVAAVLPWGFTVSIIVAGLLGITGWFGGELTFRHKIGVIGPTSQDR